jgi:hypothetical protein
MRNQLSILKKEQQQRLAELAKKPDLQLFAGGGRLGGLIQEPVTAKAASSRGAVFELILKNSGDLTAHEVNFKIFTSEPDVVLNTNPVSYPVPVPQGTREHAVIVPLSRMPPGTSTLITLTLSYPLGTKEFPIYFGLDGENVPNTSAGTILFRVPKVP